MSETYIRKYPIEDGKVNLSGKTFALRDVLDAINREPASEYVTDDEAYWEVMDQLPLSDFNVPTDGPINDYWTEDYEAYVLDYELVIELTLRGW